MKFICVNEDSARKRVGHSVEPKLVTFTERHKIRLHLPPLHETKDPLGEMMQSGAEGMVIALSRGWPDFATLQLIRKVLRCRRRVWFYWPDELAVECIDGERLRNYCLHWLVIHFYQYFFAWGKRHLWPRTLIPNSANVVPGSIGNAEGALDNCRFDVIETDDVYKDEIQKQWNENPCGSQYAKENTPLTLEWFHEVESYRYKEYAPWMLETMEFSRHQGQKVLEIGAGLGTDLCQFASNGAEVTDLDLSAGHLILAKENFKLRGLTGRFIHHDAEDLPFDDSTFDVVYSNGVLHHTPNTTRLVQEIWRVLKPGGKAVVMVYAQNSWHYWVLLVFRLGLINEMLQQHSMGEIMSRHVEMRETGSNPLVKVYTKRTLRKLFGKFQDVEIVKRQLTASELPRLLRRIPLGFASKFIGWNLVIKAIRPYPGVGKSDSCRVRYKT